MLMPRFKLLGAFSILCAVSILSTVASPPSAAFADEPAIGEDILLTDIELRADVDVDIHVRVFGEIDRNCQFAVHGFSHTAESWAAYADAVGGCVLSIDLPGRGRSSLPRGLLYSHLLLDDHVSAIIATLDRLEENFDIEPHTIVGHSQGGLLIQMTQQRLVDWGSSLEHRFDIREAVLLASAAPDEVPSVLFDSGAGLALFLSLLVDDPERGPVIRLPAELFGPLIFTNSQGQLAAGTPTPEEIVANGWNAPSEPMLATLQLAGGQGFATPSVDPGIFAEDTRLRVLAHQEDLLILPSENALLYEYLTDDETGDCMDVLTGPDAVHDVYVADPSAVVLAVADLDGCGYDS